MEKTEKKSRKPRFNQRDRRQEFIQAAQKIFHEKGYDNTTIRDIAKVAKASVGLVFSYFKSKDELIMEIIHQRREESLSAVNKILAQNKSFYQLLKEFYKFQLKYHETHYESQKILLSQAIKNPLIAKQWQEIITQRRLVPLTNFIQNRIHTGELPKGTNATVLADIIIANSYYIGFIRHFIIGVDKKSCENELMFSAEIMAKGLGVLS